MSTISDHKRNLNQAKDNVNRMMGEVDTLLASPEPNYQRVTQLFDLMETACRSGFDNAYEIQYKDHGAEAPKTPAATSTLARQ